MNNLGFSPYAIIQPSTSTEDASFRASSVYFRLQIRPEHEQMSEWVLVGTTEQIPPGTSKVVVHENSTIAVFNVDGDYFAISNICPHAAGPLMQGFIENGRIVCPWHGWSFPLSPVDPPNDGLPRYRVCVDGNRICIEVPEIEVNKGWK